MSTTSILQQRTYHHTSIATFGGKATPTDTSLAPPSLLAHSKQAQAHAHWAPRTCQGEREAPSSGVGRSAQTQMGPGREGCVLRQSVRAQRRAQRRAHAAASVFKHHLPSFPPSAIGPSIKQIYLFLDISHYTRTVHAALPLLSGLARSREERDGGSARGAQSSGGCTQQAGELRGRRERQERRSSNSLLLATHT